MLYREIIAVCSEIHTKHINTQCGQNVELLNVKLVVHIMTTGLERFRHLYHRKANYSFYIQPIILPLQQESPGKSPGSKDSLRPHTVIRVMSFLRWVYVHGHGTGAATTVLRAVGRLISVHSNIPTRSQSTL